MTKSITIYLIENDHDHANSLEKLSNLMDIPTPNNVQIAEIDLLATVIESYEKTNFPIGETTPQEAIEFSMSVRCLTESEASKKLGFSLAKIFNAPDGTDGITIRQAKMISNTLGTPLTLIVR